MSGIAYSIEKNDSTLDPVTLFIGAGFSFSSGVRIAGELAKKVIDEIYISDEERKILKEAIEENKGIQDIADYLERKSPSSWYTFKEKIAKNLHVRSPAISPEYRMLAFLIKKKRIDAVYTTNQDNCLERALDHLGVFYNRFVYPCSEANLNFQVNGNVDIFKLCGDIHTPYDMCFSEKELARASKSQLFGSFLKRFHKKGRIIFIGYSAYNDPLGKRLREASSERCFSEKHADVYCVDIKINENHKGLVKSFKHDQLIETPAETYLRDEILNIRPELSVKHALFNKNGFGGVQTYAYSLIKLCEQYAPKKLSISYYDTRDFYNRSRDIKEHAYGFQYDLGSMKAETIKAICANRPDIIHAHSHIAGYMAEKLGVPCLLTSHSLESAEVRIRKLLEVDSKDHKTDPFAVDIDYIEKEYYPQLSRILVLSEFHRGELPLGVTGTAKESPAPFLTPESLGVDTTISSYDKRKELQEKDYVPLTIKKINGETSKLAIEKKTIAFFGRPDIRKGINIFLKMAGHFLGDEDVQILFVGPSIPDIPSDKMQDQESINTITFEMEESYHPKGSVDEPVDNRLIQQMYIARDDITPMAENAFTEHLKRMYDYILASDVIVMPSTYETFGYVALEAMACNRPVVASDIGGLQTLLENSRGTLVDISNINTLDRPFSQDSEHKNAIEKFVVDQGKAFADVVKRILDEGASDQVRHAKDWVDSTYHPDKMKELVDRMYDYYLDSIIEPRRLDSEFKDTLNSFMKETLREATTWDDLLEKSADVYQICIKKKELPTDGGQEYYEVFEEIARWLKANKSVCEEINVMPVADLAELITSVYRINPNK